VAESIRLRPRLRRWRREHLVPASRFRDELTRFPLNLCPRSRAAPWWFVLRMEPDHIDPQKMTAPQRDFPKGQAYECAFGRSEPERLNPKFDRANSSDAGGPTAIGFGTYLLISA
jgi:hypothetical protein